MAVIKTNGGYNSLPISYKRGNPIPLDKSAVWYDYDLMVAYATSNPTAYVGQILSLVDTTDTSSAKAYIILNTAGDIEEIGSGSLSSAVDSIELRLESLEESVTKLIDLVGTPADAEDNVVASGIFAELDKKANAANVYTKDETNIQISNAVANVAHLKRKEVDSVEDINVDVEDAEQYIYMVPSGLKDDDNKYYEYMVIEVEVTDSEGIVTKIKKVEMVGSWSVDLNEYAKVSDLANYATTEALGAEKTRAETAETTLANDIKELQNNVSTLQTNVENVETELTEKVDKVYYTVENDDGTISKVEGTLLTPEEKEKLAALSIDEDGSIGISGTVSVDNVQGLGTWLTDNAPTYISGLTENNLSQSVLDKLNFIIAVDKAFTVTNGTLYLNDINPNKVIGLNDLISTVGNLEESFTELDSIVNNPITGLNAINTQVLTLEETIDNLSDNYVTIENFNQTVGDLNSLLDSTKGTIIEQIKEINSRLTWQELEENE